MRPPRDEIKVLLARRSVIRAIGLRAQRQQLQRGAEVKLAILLIVVQSVEAIDRFLRRYLAIESWVSN